ncbi:MAG: DUF58 domain-containing protein [Pseudoxanthomonas sp.]
MTPAAPLIVLLVAWSLCGLAVLLLGVPMPAWWASGAVLAALAAFDAWRLRRRETPLAVRELPEALPLGVQREVTLRIETLAQAQRLEVFDLHPGGWHSEGLPQKLKLPPLTTASFAYQLRPTERGDAQFDGVQLHLSSPLRLWKQIRVAGEPQRVRVFPNFVPLTRYALFSAEQASRLVGAHIKRRRGEGTDFHQMREYRTGDSLRQLDWKATARMRKLISREYQDEKNQQVMLLLDTGRRMLAREPAAAQAGELSHFDHALNAALVVSYLALRQGDAVGLYASGDAPRWVAPQRGMGAIDTLLRASYDLQAQPVATDYLAAATELSLRQRRRALVMLATNVRDEDIEDLLAAVRLLQKRHLVCVASLRETAIDAALSQPVHDLPDAIRSGAVARYLEQRSAAHDVLRGHRVMVLDTTCEDLPAALVERYLAVKRDGLL